MTEAVASRDRSLSQLARFCLRIGENPTHRRRSENPSSEKVIREKDFLECSIFRPPKNGDYRLRRRDYICPTESPSRRLLLAVPLCTPADVFETQSRTSTGLILMSLNSANQRTYRRDRLVDGCPAIGMTPPRQTSRCWRNIRRLGPSFQRLVFAGRRPFVNEGKSSCDDAVTPHRGRVSRCRFRKRF